MLLDQATYFTADEPIELEYFSIGSLDLNPIEEYWRRLKKALGNRYFGTFDKISSLIWDAPSSISPRESINTSVRQYM
jgi:transposase